MDVYGSLGANEVEVAIVPGGIQQLSPGLADSVLTLLNKRVMVTDPVQAQGTGVFNIIAVTMAQLSELGLKTSDATKSAGAYIAGLPAGQYALANINDAVNLKLGNENIFHFTIAAAAAVPTIAGPGSTLAVLSPLVGGGAATAETPAKEEKKFSVLTPILGAGIGLLVGGPVGAAVGAGIGLGVEVLRAA